jgi:hypothetical protein
MAPPKSRGVGVQHPLITWIRYRTHACTTLRVHAEDSSVTELELDRTAKNPYRKAAMAALSYKPTKIEALNKGGKVLDVWTAEQEDEPAAAETTTERIGDDLLAQGLDGESTRLVIFARLLADAYKSSNAFSGIAFQRLVDVCNVGNERAASLERMVATLERSLTRTTRRTVTAEETTSEPGLLEQVIGNVVAGMAMKMKNGAVPPSAPATADNGETEEGE